MTGSNDAAREHQQDYEAAIDQWEQVLAWSNQHGDRKHAEIATKKLESLRKRFAAATLSKLEREDQFEALFDRPPSKRTPSPRPYWGRWNVNSVRANCHRWTYRPSSRSLIGRMVVPGASRRKSGEIDSKFRNGHGRNRAVAKWATQPKKQKRNVACGPTRHHHRRPTYDGGNLLSRIHSRV